MIVITQMLLMLFGYQTYLSLWDKSRSAASAATFTPINPPSFPLAVRSPYLSDKAWIPGSNVTSLATSPAQFWYGQSLGWTVAARVGNQSYSLFGNPGIGEETELISAQYTSTQTIFKLAAGESTFTLDFFSPVSPSNYIRQSLPFSYLTISAESSSQDIEIYSDVDASWMGDTGSSMSWTLTADDDTQFYLLKPDTELLYSENKDMPCWGQIVYATRASTGSDVTAQVGPRTTVRNRFSVYGTLGTTVSNSTWTSDSVVGFAHKLSSQGSSVRFAVGQQRDMAVNYLGIPMTGYYRSKYPSIGSAIVHFLDDYSDALAEAKTLDSNIKEQAKKAYDSNHNASDYYTILSLALRQSFAGTEIVIPYSNLSTTDAMAFVKEISSDGNVNTFGVIFSHFALHYVANPDILRLLLTPILKYLDSGRWPHAFAIHDIGSNYPNATGHDDGTAELMPVEDSGNINLLTYAYYHATGDTSWSLPYKSLLRGYADYLANNGWYPVRQLSTTDGAGYLANQTVLATKAALGMNCFGTLFSESFYTANATALANLLYTSPTHLGTDSNRTHWDLKYHSDSTWLSNYNLFPTSLFSFTPALFPPQSYTMQSHYLPTVRLEKGIPLDSRVLWTRSDLGLYVAAVSDETVKEIWIEDIVNYLGNGLNDVPFSDRWFVGGVNAGKTGENFRARPTVGGHFSLVAMEGGAGAIMEGID
ncbi:MAG: hypothetical protein M1834_001196 [Cirrosporium novae-zelandiae]|nr:MAG: hypothetical protein M1834_001196 [Cirrosporium novae-zelandiae]